MEFEDSENEKGVEQEMNKKLTSILLASTMILSLGLTGKNDEASWKEPAENLPPAAEDEIRPGGQAPDSR